jgi:hypothetical protein
MSTRDTFDKTVHLIGTGKGPGSDGIPNEIIKFLPHATHSAPCALLSLLAHKSDTPRTGATTPHAYCIKKGDPALLANYRPIALVNNLLKLWIALLKDARSKYAETYRILIEHHDGFRLLRSIHDALVSIIVMMEDAKIKSTTNTSTQCTRTSKAPSTPLTTVSCSNTCAN